MRAVTAAVFLLVVFAFSFPIYAKDTAPVNNPGELVRIVLEGDPQARAQAQYALVKLGGKAVPALLEALDKREKIPELVFVLNGIKDKRAAGALASLLDLKDADALEKVEEALFSLGNISVPYLFEALRDKDRCVNAAEVLSTLKDPDSRETLRLYLRDDEPYIRQGAARVERSWLDLAAAGEMEALLTDGNAQVRRDASAYFLGQAPNLPVKGLPALLADGDAEVRKNAVRTATKLRDARCFERLSAVLLKDTDPEARRLAVEAVFRCNKEIAAPQLVLALKDDDPSVASAAAARLGEMKAAEALGPLQELLKNKGKSSDEVVDAVAGALADLGMKFDADILLPYVNWDNLYVVRSVIRAWELSALPGDAKVKQALEKYLKMPVDNRYKDRVKTLLDRLG